MSTFVHTTVTAEVRRLRATRSTTVSLLAVLVFTAFIAVATVLLAGHQENGPLTAHTLDDAIRAPAKVLGFVLLLVGVLLSAGEHRHHTVVPTLLAEPRRRAVVAAKVAAMAGWEPSPPWRWQRWSPRCRCRCSARTTRRRSTWRLSRPGCSLWS